LTRHGRDASTELSGIAIRFGVGREDPEQPKIEHGGQDRVLIAVDSVEAKVRHLPTIVDLQRGHERLTVATLRHGLPEERRPIGGMSACRPTRPASRALSSSTMMAGIGCTGDQR
jgi:hypothetical protein